MKQIIDSIRYRSSLGFAVAWLLAAIASAAYPPQWHEADGAPAALGGAFLRGIAFGGGKFVVVPAYDAEGKLTSATSQDGMAWTKGRPFPVQKQLHSVASNGNFFVGVGYAGVALSSVDGLDWTAGTSGVTVDLNGVAYGAGKFVAVGPSGKVLTSTNGITWMTTILPADLSYSNFDTIEFGNGKFIVPYGSSSIMTSDDGLVWTKKGTGQSNDFSSLAYGNNLWVAGGSGSIFYSKNIDINWIGQGMGTAIKATAFVNGVFVAYGIGGGKASIFSSAISSTNTQAEWTSVASPLNTSTAIYDIASDGSRFVAVGQYGRVIVSDAVTPPGVLTSTIAVVAEPPVAGTVTGGGTFSIGSQIPISAVSSNPAFWEFIEWREDGNRNSSRTITVPAAASTFTAVFARTVELWQRIDINAPNAIGGPADFKVEFTRMLEGTEIRVEAEILSVRAGMVTVRVPPGLLGRANLSDPPMGVDRNVRAEVLRASDRTVIARQAFILRMPRPLIVDELVVATASPGLRTLPQFDFNTGGFGEIQTFAFLGHSSDGQLGLRVLNSELDFPPPLLFDTDNVALFEPGGGSAPLQRLGTFTIPNLGTGNRGAQFNVSKNGLYLIAIEPHPDSHGPFPASYQVHLAGNVGLPRKLINGQPEAARGTRLDTLFNHPAPRPQALRPVARTEARTALFKFANVASISPYAKAVLIPPAGGFANGQSIVRAADPLAPLELTTPTARTPECAAPVAGNIIDFTQLPDPASIIDPSPVLAESVCAVIGQNDGQAVTLPKTLPGGTFTISSLIMDMGSGNEIVDGPGADFEVLASNGSYSVQVGNNPFSGSFFPVPGSFSKVAQIDLATVGLTSARYVWITASPEVVLDAVRALNLFADEISASLGPITHVTSATITVRRAKTSANLLDPFVQLIAPNGDLFAENEAGFGDDLSLDLSDAALINRILPQDGFYRYLVKGFDKQPDAITSPPVHSSRGWKRLATMTRWNYLSVNGTSPVPAPRRPGSSQRPASAIPIFSRQFPDRLSISWLMPRVQVPWSIRWLNFTIRRIC